MQPRFVVERVIADLVPDCCYRGYRSTIFLKSSILTDNKKCDLEVSLFQKREHARHDNIEIRWEGIPARITVRLHIRPFIVEVERKARYLFHKKLPANYAKKTRIRAI